jgi:uncharacterized damage-inducible protein DinB
MTMVMTKFFTDQLDREVAASRKVLERVPEGRDDWKPHERSMAMGYLAALVAQMPAWIAMMLTSTELNLDDKDARGKFQAQASESSKALLKLAEDSAEKAKSALSSATEDDLNVVWSLKMHGKTLNSGPRHQQIADAFTHLAHHRGQLTVYLRLNEIPVPAIFGPSADEPGS